MSYAKPSLKSSKVRLDKMLVVRELAETEKHAQALIMMGKIRVNGQPAMKPGARIAVDARIEITGQHQKYASRAGLKLEGALEDFGVSASRCVCLDLGASTGGFTDCLLQHGAHRVYSVDVNSAQLNWKLQRAARVVAIEKNARYLKPSDIVEAIDFVTIDVSFISVAKIIPAAAAIAKQGTILLILIKPQFELPRKFVVKGGIVRDPALQERAIASIIAAAQRAGIEILGVKPSRVAGAGGNQEFFLHARRAG